MLNSHRLLFAAIVFGFAMAPMSSENVIAGIPPDNGNGPFFTDVTDLLGVGDREHHHFGIAVVDINGDGWLDFYWPNGHSNPVPPPPSGECPEENPPLTPDPQNLNACFLNNGDGTFAPNQAAQMGIDDPWNGMRNVFADYDNDGLLDLLSHNFIVSSLYRAVSSNPPKYQDVSASSGMEICITNGTATSWVDMNNDGYLDVYACEWSPNRPPEEMVNYMFLNDGDGTFTDITVEAGTWLPNSPGNDNPMGSAFADFDNDGDQDFFVANSPPAPTRLWRNDGVNGNGVPQFTDIAEQAGVSVSDDNALGFGTSWGDYNNDGYLDLIFTRMADSRVWRNNGPPGWTFTDISSDLGLPGLGIFHDGNFFDANNDGWLDLVFAEATEGANRLFLNNGDVNGSGDVTWEEVGELYGISQPEGRDEGVIPADYDNDGSVDLIFWDRAEGEPNRVYRNEIAGNNWIQFRLTGTVSNRDAVGARIEVEAQINPPDPEVTQIREVVAGTGFFDDLPRIQYFGLGEATEISTAKIVWPSGVVQIVGPLEANQRYDIEEPFDSDLCGDISSFQARCVAGEPYTLQFRINLFNSIVHSHEEVTFDVDGTQYVANIGDNGTHSRASFQLTGQSAGSHTISLVDPAGCFDPIVIDCGAGNSFGAEWEAADALWGEADATVTPSTTKLIGNYPNPFNPSTTISYLLAEGANVSVRIYNTLGQEVATLVDGYQEAGYKSVLWDGRDGLGRSVASGIYVYRMQTEKVVETRKLLLLK